MQYFALNSQGTRIAAKDAAKHDDYLCPACFQTVRVRKGSLRRPHFYHPKLHPSHCHFYGKSLIHAKIQDLLAQQLPSPTFIEHSFPAIRRIADLACLPLNIVFEIQCSPLSSQEVIKRIKDYQCAHFDVIWILHERAFPPARPSAVQKVLRQRLHYYTDVDVEGNGSFYEYAMPSHKIGPVDFSHFRTLSSKEDSFNPHIRRQGPTYSFQGDLAFLSPPLQSRRKRNLLLSFLKGIHNSLLRFFCP